MRSWREHRLSALTFLVLAGAMAGCTASGPGALPAASAENAGGADRMGAVPVSAGGRATPAALEAAVRADAARFWGRSDPSALQVSVEGFTWSDGALGCPRPGLMYTQALVPGYRLVVRDGAREAVYHASQRGQWILCPPGRAGRPLPGDATR